MPVEEYANQPFVKKHKSFDYIAKICLEKKENKYAGFSALSTTTATNAKKSYLYSNYQEHWSSPYSTNPNNEKIVKFFVVVVKMY